MSKANQQFLEFFSEFDFGTLFSVYDLEKSKYIRVDGRNGTYVMNKNTVSMFLSELESVENLVVIINRNGVVDYMNPVFIGSQDANT